MCGIVGFTGRRQAAQVLLDGLAKLEYRGYDSAGIAVRDGEKDVEIVKAKSIIIITAAVRAVLPAACVPPVPAVSFFDCRAGRRSRPI